MVPVCDKRYHIFNRFRHFWAEITKMWNYPFQIKTIKYSSVTVYLTSSKMRTSDALINSTHENGMRYVYYCFVKSY